MGVESWEKILAHGFSKGEDLLRFLNLPITLNSILAEKQFKMRVPYGFAERMQAGNPNDPLLLQVLAVEEEEAVQDNFIKDPLAEKDSNPLPGLIHKYQGRVLLLLTGACAVNCRYCFRRHFPYAQNQLPRQRWQAILDYIQANQSISEVILSGGDPLLAADLIWKSLIFALSEIPHLKTLRIHSRIPIVLPERITTSFLKLFSQSSLQKVMVLHTNHPQEINNPVKKACSDLKSADFFLLNQSVLLKGVNDRVEVLKGLSEELFKTGVLPYYLHTLDKVAGAAHFDLPLVEALSLYRELQKQVPGYLLPRLAVEKPGQASKTILV